MAPNRGSILIQVRGSEEVVEVQLDELPSDANDIIDILKGEIAPLDLWLRFAVEYYKQGKIEQFKMILSEATEPGPEEYFRDSKKERIAILNTLAAYYTSLAAKEKEKSKKEEYFNLATQNYNRADKIDFLEEITWIGKGVLLFTKGDSEQALKCFEIVLDKCNQQNTPALLGKACVYYNKGEYEEALKAYKLALQQNPGGCPPTVRLAMGLCYYKLGRSDLAKIAFERTLALDEDNVDALVGVAILEMNSEKADAISSALQLLKRAYEINPQHSRVLNQLSNHFFYKKDYPKAESLAKSAYNNTEVMQIKAESFYYLGRCYQAQEDYEAAFTCYREAVRLWPEYVLAQYGLGQLYIWKTENEKAISCFENVLASHPDNFETLKILGYLYTQSNRKEKALSNFKKITEHHPFDADSWIEMAHLIELTNFKDALEAYERALKIFGKKGAHIASELWNNIGVLRHRLEMFGEAEQAYMEVLKETGENRFKDEYVTTTFNLARLYEDRYELTKAEDLYRGIVKEHPNYVDCYLRLGIMARNKGQTTEAAEMFKEVFAINADHPDAWCLLGNLHMEKEEWLQGQKKFERVLEKSSADAGTDSYPLLSLGNLYYTAKFDKKEKEERYLKLAMDFYHRVLSKEPSNVYAANGLGIIMAEKGRTLQAKDFFSQVREATGDMPDVWVNLGHVYYSQGQFTNAILIYQNCLKKFYMNKDPMILLFLAKCFYDFGELNSCRSALRKAIGLTPWNMMYWFNLVVCELQSAKTVMKKEKPKLVEVKKAQKELLQAKKTAEHLSSNKNVISNRNYSTTKAGELAKSCAKTLQKMNTYVIEIERKEEERERKKEEFRLSAERLIEQKKKLEMEEVRKKEEEASRLEQLARQGQERLQSLAAKWQEEDSREKAKDTKEKEKDEDSGEEGEKGKKKKKGRKGKKSKKEEEGEGGKDLPSEEEEARLSEDDGEAKASDNDGDAAEGDDNTPKKEKAKRKDMSALASKWKNSKKMENRKKKDDLFGSDEDEYLMMIEKKKGEKKKRGEKKKKDGDKEKGKKGRSRGKDKDDSDGGSGGDTKDLFGSEESDGDKAKGSGDEREKAKEKSDESDGEKEKRRRRLKKADKQVSEDDLSGVEGDGKAKGKGSDVEGKANKSDDEDKREHDSLLTEKRAGDDSDHQDSESKMREKRERERDQSGDEKDSKRAKTSDDEKERQDLEAVNSD